jgi:hypothetical protein
MLILVAGVSGSGKSTICAILRQRGYHAVDADWDGYNHWVHRRTGERPVEPPSQLPPRWLDTYAWRMDAAKVAELRDDAVGRPVFLFGTVENEDELWGLFDLVICLVIDDATVRHRLATRTTNSFGKQADELDAALGWNQYAEARYRRAGARIIDATLPLEKVVSEVLTAAGSLPK